MFLYPDVLLLSAAGLILTLAARALTGQAREFLLENEGPCLTRVQCISVTFVFICAGMLLTLGALNSYILWPDAIKHITLLAWGIPMVLLDIRTLWLPFRYTTGFWLTGFLFTFLPSSPLTLTEALTASSLMFAVLYVFHVVTWHIRGEEGFGLGDVHLIAALCAWFPWQQASLLSGYGFLLLIIAALLTRRTALPYAPWLFALLALHSGNLSQPTLSGSL